MSFASFRAATSTPANSAPSSTARFRFKRMARKKIPEGASGTPLKAAAQSLFDDFLPHRIARLAYLLNSDLIEKLRHEGINVTRWRILAVLAMGDGITIKEIIDRAMMQQSALSRALMRWEKENYGRV